MIKSGAEQYKVWDKKRLNMQYVETYIVKRLIIRVRKNPI